jgi:hypothetical protein
MSEANAPVGQIPIIRKENRIKVLEGTDNQVSYSLNLIKEMG